MYRNNYMKYYGYDLTYKMMLWYVLLLKSFFSIMSPTLLQKNSFSSEYKGKF